MNRIYHSISNEISRAFVAVAENVRGRGKPAPGICADGAMTAASRPDRQLARHRPLPLALEQRFMFDGAAVAEAHAVIAAVAAPVEVRAADPTLDNGKKEVVFVDTSVADYKTLEAGVKAGVAIVEIDGTKDGLAQIAQWAQTHNGYDSIAILGHGSQATLNLGTTTLTSASLSSAVVQTELAEIGQALTSDGDLMLYGCDIAKSADGEAFIAALASATGADVAASTDATGAADKGGDWTLEYHTGSIEATTLAASDYQGLLTSTTFDFETVTLGTTSKTITQTVGADTIVITSTDANMLVDTELNAFGSDVLNAYGVVLATGEGAVYPESSVTLSVAGVKTFDLTSFTLVQVGGDGQTITLATNKGSETFTASFVDNSWVINLSSAANPSYFTGVTSVVITTADTGGVFEWGFDNIVLSNITDPNAPPSTTVATAVLSADTGTSASDFVTRTAAQTISGTLSANLASGEEVQVSYDGGTSWSNATYTVGSTSWSTTTTLTGSNTFEARVTNSNGSSTAYTHSYTVDTTAPTTSFSNIALSADAGASASDFVTNTAAQTISATLSSAPAGTDTVWASVNGGASWTDVTSKVSGTTLSWDGATLGAGSSSIMLKVSDAAGNESGVSSQNYTLDATAPSTVIASATFSADSGTSSTDFITHTAAQTVSGTLSANLASGETVYVSLDNGATWNAASATVGHNDWALAGVTLTTSNTLKIRVSDTAGNYGSVLTQAYVLDTTAPTTSFGGLALSADTGASSNDFITKTAAQTISATLSGVLAGSDIVYGSLDNGATWTDITSKVSGTTLSWNGVTLLGSHTLLLRVVDAAGNGGTVRDQAYWLDTAAPSAPLALDLASASDSGDSNTDKLTQVSTPTVTGTAQAGSTVALYDTNGTTVLGTATADGSGGWSITSSTLASGTHTLTAKTTDTAGNVSDASAGISITIDSSAPATSSVTVPASGTYYVGNALDFTVNFNEAIVVNTSGGTPRIAIVVGATTRYADYISGSDTSALVFRYVVPSGDNDSNGITVGALAANGASFQDAAGNDAVITLNSVGSTASINVDGSQPSVTSVSSTTADGSYGAGSTIAITVDFSRAVDVASSGGTPTLALGDGGLATYVSGSGTSTLVFSYTVATGKNSADLDYSSSSALALNGATIVDASGAHQAAVLTLATPGTAGSLGANKAIVIDTAAPSSPAVPTLAAASDSGTSNSDGITVDTTPTISGSAEAGSTVTLYDSDGTTVLGSATADASGAWTIICAVLADGVHTLTAKASDAAGNVSSASSGLALTIDTSAQTPTTLALAAASDSGTSSSDGITRVTTPTITGATEANAAVTLFDSDGSTVLGRTTADALGRWSITSTALSVGTHALTARASDAAGNSGAASSPLAVTIDTSAPATPVLSAAASGTSSSVSTPTISGSAEAGSTVTLYDSDGSIAVGHTTADGAGRWSITSAALSTGAHALTAKASDASGNSSAASSALTVTIGTSTPPLIPVELVTPTVAAVPVAPATVAADPAPTADPAPLASFLTPATELALGRPTTTLLAALAPAATSTPSAANETAGAASATTPLTHGGGFAVIVASAGGSSADGLFVNRGLADLAVASGATSQFSIPADAFAASRADALVTLEARQANGQALPAWVNFNAASGTFEVQAAPGVADELTIRVIARDAQGHEAVITFKIRVGEKATRDTRHAQPERAGRAGLSEQIRLAARPHPALDRLARLLGGRPAA